MSSNTVSGARLAAALGLASSGALAGVMLSISTITVPTMLAASHATDSAVIVRAFSRMFHQGRNTVVPLSVSSGAFLAYAAYAATLPRARITYGTAAALCVSVMPWTLLVMKRGIDVLLGAEASAEKRAQLGMDGAVGEIVAWAKLHWVRTTMASFGCATALWAAQGFVEYY